MSVVLKIHLIASRVMSLPIMREAVLRDFFLGRITPTELATDVRGSTKKVTLGRSLSSPFRIYHD